MTYLQKISDITTGGALHIEPGIWIHIPSQDTGTGSSAKESVARMGNIPHGNSLLAQGTAIKLDPFTGNPFNPDSVAAVNTAPFPVGDAFPPPAPGTGIGMPVPGTLSGFPPYDLSNLTPAAVNFRTPAGNTPAVPLPATILGVPMQDVILDPTKLLTAALSGQTISSMVVNQHRHRRNFAAATACAGPRGAAAAQEYSCQFQRRRRSRKHSVPTNERRCRDGVCDLLDRKDKGSTPDADFMQLQYVQTVFLNFPVLNSPPPQNSLTWPHVSVATLQKTFGGQ